MCVCAYTLNTDGKPFLLSIRSWGTLEDVIHLYTQSLLPGSVFIEFHFTVGLTNSIRTFDANAPQFTNGTADFVHTVASLAPRKSPVSWWEITDTKNLKVIGTRRDVGKGLPLWDRDGKSRLKQRFYLQSIFFVDTTAVLRNYFIKVFQWVSRMHKVLVWLASVVYVCLYLDIPDSPWSLTNSTKQKWNLPLWRINLSFNLVRE